jgi:hypothetical protein
MRTAILISLWLLASSDSSGQTPPAGSKPASPQTKPAPPPATQPAPATPPATTARPPQAPPVRRQPANTRGGIAIRVTNEAGNLLEGIDVRVVGTADRAGKSDAGGQVNFPGLPAGTYRLRFSGESVVTFEREVVVRAGAVADMDVSLTPAAPPPPAPAPVVIAAPPAPAPRPSSGPTGQPQALSILDLLEKDFIGRQPRRESLLSCSGETHATMLQLNERSPDRLFADADSVYYVLGGEATLRMNDRESRINTNGFLSVPRGTRHSFERRGNRPLVLLVVQGGEPCQEAR